MKKPNTQYYNNTGEVNSRKKLNDIEICERSTVIVSPSKSNADGGYGFNAPSSSQDSDSSDDDQPIMPSVHKTLIKPKSAAAPVINHKATAMMVSLIFLQYILCGC